MTSVGVVGLGGMGGLHSTKYRQMPDVELFVYDLDPARTEEVALRNQAEGCSSLAEILEKVQVVDVCVPNDLHLEIGLQAISARKHLLMEKPLCRTLQQCRELIDAAASAGVKLMSAQVVRYFADYEAAHKLVKSGNIGTPATARLRRGGKAPQGSKGWFQDPNRSGGVLLDLAIHDFDWLLWTIGPVESVYAKSLRLSPEAGKGEFVGDYALCTLRHQNGCLSHVEATWMDPSGFRTTVEVCGSEGMFEYDSRANAALRVHSATGSVAEPGLASEDDPYYRELRGFLDAVREDKPVPIDPKEAAQAVAVAEAAIRSAQTGQAANPEPF